MKQFCLTMCMCILVAISTSFTAQASETEALPLPYKTFDIGIEGETETTIDHISFREHGIMSLVVNEWAKNGYYEVNDEYIILSYDETEGVTVNLYLSYDALGNDDITGTIEDVRLELRAPLKESYNYMYEDFIGKNYTLEFLAEYESQNTDILTIPDPRLAVLKYEMYIMRHDGLDEYIYFHDYNQLWMEEKVYQPSGFYPEGYYGFIDDYLVLELNVYDNDHLQIFLTYDDIENEVIEVVIDDLKWVSLGEPPSEYEDERAEAIGMQFELLLQDRDADLAGESYKVDVGSGGVTVHFRENNIVEIEYFDTSRSGVYRTFLDYIEIEFEESLGVTTLFSIPFSNLSTDDDGSIEGSNVRHEFSSEIFADVLDEFESILSTERH